MRFFTLRHASGQVQTISYRVSRVGEQKVPLNFKISPGSNQVLELTRGSELSVVKTNFTYPIAIADVLSIKYANNVNGTDDYPYFFNWEIEHGYPCGRTPVFVKVSQKPQAQFSVPSGSLSVNTALSFQDQSKGATRLLWNFGNGQVSTDNNPSTTYANAGAYQVTLSASNDSGCSDVSVKTIQIGTSTSTQEQETLAYQLNIFPNPTQDEVNVSFSLDRSRLVRVNVINSIGQTLYSQNLGERTAGQEKIALPNLPSGAYWLMFEVDGVKVAKPLMIK